MELLDYLPWVLSGLLFSLCIYLLCKIYGNNDKGYESTRSDEYYVKYNLLKDEYRDYNDKTEQLKRAFNCIFELYKILEIDGCNAHTKSLPKVLDTKKVISEVQLLKSSKLECCQNEVPTKSTTSANNVLKCSEAKLSELIKYADFPRSSGSMIYFTDVSETKNDDSFFELEIDASGQKATFKPLDFLKIRGVDEAMLAIKTEGVRPNLANSVIGITPGTAVLEGDVWKIKEQAKIKLA